MNPDRIQLVRIAAWARWIAWVSLVIGILGFCARFFNIILAYSNPDSLGLYGESILWGRSIYLSNGIGTFFWIGMMFVLLQAISLLIHRLLALESRLRRDADL